MLHCIRLFFVDVTLLEVQLWDIKVVRDAGQLVQWAGVILAVF